MPNFLKPYFFLFIIILTPLTLSPADHPTTLSTRGTKRKMDHSTARNLINPTLFETIKAHILDHTKPITLEFALNLPDPELKIMALRRIVLEKNSYRHP